jgi:hypothetical protein
MGTADRAKSLRIGQSRVEQNNVDDVPHKMRFGRAHAIDARHFGIVLAVFVEHRAKQANVSGIIFYQQNRFDHFGAHQRNPCAGGAKFVGWRSSMRAAKPFARPLASDSVDGTSIDHRSTRQHCRINI